MAVQSTLNRLRSRPGTLAVLAVVGIALQGLSFVAAPGALLARPQQLHSALSARGGDDDGIAFDVQGMGVVTLASLKPGQELQGVVTKVLDRAAIVDVGLEKEGFVPAGKLADGRVDSPADVVREGQDVRVWVVEATASANPRESKLVLSMSKKKIVDQRSLGPRVELETFKEVSEDTWLPGTVVGEIGAGVFVSVEAPDGSGQAQALCLRKNIKAGSSGILSKVKVRIEDLNLEDSKMSVSMVEKPISVEVFKDSDDWMMGHVMNIANFGSFVQVAAPDGSGQAQGLVPISMRQGNPQVGDQVKVRVSEVDVEKNQLRLTMKADTSAVFKDVDEDVFLDGVVVSMTDFGAFVAVTPPDGGEPVEGLLRNGQIKDGFVEDPAEELEMDQAVKVRVLSADAKGLLLSMKTPKKTQPPPEPKQEPEEETVEA